MPPSLRRAAVPLVAVAVLCGGVVWRGADREPSVATAPVILRGETTASASEGRSIRIGTFNIHGGRAPGGDVDLGATAAVLRDSDLDLAGLNEVHGTFGDDQAADLGGRLGMASLFAGTERRWWHDHFGNGLLTQRPLRSVLRVPLPGTQSKRFRNAILATLDVGGTPVRVLATHIDTETDRDRQLAAVFELFRSLQEPAVLMGDLNSTAEYPPVAALLAEPGVVDAVAAKLGAESQAGRIDHLLVRGLTVLDAGVVETSASDHPHVWAELTVP
jgi:endonuclease/exonuclease/phosphatase family metal-dependent hydrolase